MPGRMQGCCVFSGLKVYLLFRVISWPQTLHVPSSCPFLALLLACCPFLPPWLLAYDLVFAVIFMPSVNFSHRSSSSQDVTWQWTGQTFFCLISHTHTNEGFVYRYAISVDMHFGACVSYSTAICHYFFSQGS